MDGCRCRCILSCTVLALRLLDIDHFPAGASDRVVTFYRICANHIDLLGRKIDEYSLACPLASLLPCSNSDRDGETKLFQSSSLALLVALLTLLLTTLLTLLATLLAELTASTIPLLAPLAATPTVADALAYNSLIRD